MISKDKKKYCPKCDRKRVLAAFNTSSSSADGLQGYCRKCATKLMTIRNKEAKKELEKLRRVAETKPRTVYIDPEKILLDDRYYHLSHSEILKVQHIANEQKLTIKEVVSKLLEGALLLYASSRQKLIRAKAEEAARQQDELDNPIEQVDFKYPCQIRTESTAEPRKFVKPRGRMSNAMKAWLTATAE